MKGFVGVLFFIVVLIIALSETFRESVLRIVGLGERLIIMQLRVEQAVWYLCGTLFLDQSCGSVQENIYLGGTLGGSWEHFLGLYMNMV